MDGLWINIAEIRCTNKILNMNEWKRLFMCVLSSMCLRYFVIFVRIFSGFVLFICSWRMCECEKARHSRLACVHCTYIVWHSALHGCLVVVNYHHFWQSWLWLIRTIGNHWFDRRRWPHTKGSTTHSHRTYHIHTHTQLGDFVTFSYSFGRFDSG